MQREEDSAVAVRRIDNLLDAIGANNGGDGSAIARECESAAVERGRDSRRGVNPCCRRIAFSSASTRLSS